MRPSRKLSIVWATFALVVGIATRSDAGVLIDYESTPDGALASQTEAGVTFRAVSGGAITSSLFGLTPNGTRALVGADIASGATQVSVDLGDNGGDADTLFLEVFGALNNSLGFTATLLGAGVSGMRT